MDIVSQHFFSNHKSKVIILIFIFTMTSSCSMIPVNSKNDDMSFHAVAISTSNPLMVPVEIASELSAPFKSIQNKPQVNNVVMQSKAIPRQPATTEDAKNIIYQTKNGDTLMKISFEYYGNLYRWREIYRANRNLISNYNLLISGTNLQIKNVKSIFIHKIGSPYIINRNDTLIKISSLLYGNKNEWRLLWHNNPELIHDPNKIYAGLTMYYVPIIKKFGLRSQPLSKSLNRISANHKF